MFEALTKYVQFEGRARRSEYWLFALMIFVVDVTLLVIIKAWPAIFDHTHAPGPGPGAGLMALVLFVFNLVVFLPNFAVGVRRLHDIDRSATWMFINLIPFGNLVLLVMGLIDGVEGPNRYGPDPKTQRRPDDAPPANLHRLYSGGPRA
jgi:uncharacterized membrane protein YhaH (DUF805 family)